MANKVNTKQVLEQVEYLLGDESQVEFDLNQPQMQDLAKQLPKSKVRLELSNNGIVVDIPKTGSTIKISRYGECVDDSAVSQEVVEESPVEAKKSKPKPKRYQHSYVRPKMADDIMDALLDDASHVLWFKGPTGTGKTVLVEHLAEEMGYDLHKVNCDGGIGPEGFFGDKTIEVDEESGQNTIVFKDGPVVKAMQAGLDEDGNEVGKPGLLFLDEAGSIPSHVSIALNHLLESDDPRRTICLTQDGGRQVRSHSKFRIILAANTAGRGATDMSEAAYTAQMDALDISLLNRISMTFRFGYDRNVEKHIAMEKIGDDKVVLNLMKLRDAIRGRIRSGELSTPFSTRHIVKISDAYRVYKDLGKAIYYTTFEQLLPEEKAVYNEIAMAQTGIDILNRYSDNEIDYM